jgi:hypothetical protein
MNTDYQAVARLLERLAEGAPEADLTQDLRTLARNVRILGVMMRVLGEARSRRQADESRAAWSPTWGDRQPGTSPPQITSP